MRTLKLIGALTLLLACTACDQIVSAAEPNTINLSSSEKQQAQRIAEDRQQIAFERATVQNDFQAQMNRLAEKEAAVNIESQKLCFALKKAHAISPSKNYWLDEWRGELKKQ